MPILIFLLFSWIKEKIHGQPSGKLLCIDNFGTISQEMVSSVIYCAVVATLSTPIDSMMYILFTEEISCL